jgi:hypothetical protein
MADGMASLVKGSAGSLTPYWGGVYFELAPSGLLQHLVDRKPEGLSSWEALWCAHLAVMTDAFMCGV